MTTTSRRWTDQDVATLRKYWAAGPGTVAYHLNRRLPYRTIGAVKAKARQLGLKR